MLLTLFGLKEIKLGFETAGIGGSAATFDQKFVTQRDKLRKVLRVDRVGYNGECVVTKVALDFVAGWMSQLFLELVRAVAKRTHQPVRHVHSIYIFLT